MFDLERLQHYLFDNKIKVQTDNKPLIPIWKKSIAVASHPFQCLLLRLAKYDVQLTYLKGEDNDIEDALSQVSPHEPETEGRDNFGVIQVHHITSEIPDTGSFLEAVRVSTQADQVLSQLKHQIFQGWQDARSGIPDNIYPFWNYWDELLLKISKSSKTHKLVIPTSQQEFLRDLHVGY